jgi:hypothetical protein
MAIDQSVNMIRRLREIFGGGPGKRTGPFTITEPFTLLDGRTTREICRGFKLQDEAKAHLKDEPAPEQFVERLARAKLYADATRFLAYALPERQAVWWACLCVRSVPTCKATLAIKSAEAWVRDPTESNREAALSAGGKHKFEMPGAPAAWTAMAAGWSGGAAAIDAEDVPEPPRHLTAHAGSGAILLVATMEPDEAEKVYRRCLETGVQIAQGKLQIPA